jgi:prepilin-type N-terminal cleavage/methylation domain-containing protein/prepilin-type processing-associated H-X9-DG protein
MLQRRFVCLPLKWERSPRDIMEFEVGKMKRRGFTLVELLTVLAIAAVLAAILLAVFSRVREKGRRATCQSNLKQMNLALRQYASDHDSFDVGQYNWQEALSPYIKNNQIYECPTESREENSTMTGMDTDYFYFAAFNVFKSGKYVGVNEAAHSNVDDSQLLTFADSAFGDPGYTTKALGSCGSYFVPDRHSGGGNWSFADGHVKWLTPQAGVDAICSLGIPY